MTKTATDYLTEISSKLLKGDRPDNAYMEDCLRNLDWHADNKALLRVVADNKLATDREIKEARKRFIVIDRLGIYPATATEYVETFAELSGLTVRFTGAVESPDLDLTAASLTIIDIKRRARICADEIKLPFSTSAVDDACEEWYVAARNARITDTIEDLKPREAFDWEFVASSCFDCSETSPEFIAAILKKFVHQVVTKLHGGRVGNHLMPVLFGRQGIGKTYFVEAMCRPVAEFMRTCGFKEIGDERNIDLWRSLILFADEMAKSTKTDYDEVKKAITADTLSRRLLGTNRMADVRQSATLIGCSNKSLSEIILDDTGNRRFAPLIFVQPKDRDIIDRIDWLQAWRSIKTTDSDPIIPHLATLAAVQASERALGQVEEWLDALMNGFRLDADASNACSVEKLYESFGELRDLRYPHHDQYRFGCGSFTKALHRISRDYPETFPFKKVMHSGRARWRYNGPTTPSPLVTILGGVK